MMAAQQKMAAHWVEGMPIFTKFMAIDRHKLQ